MTSDWKSPLRVVFPLLPSSITVLYVESCFPANCQSITLSRLVLRKCDRLQCSILIPDSYTKLARQRARFDLSQVWKQLGHCISGLDHCSPTIKRLARKHQSHQTRGRF